MRKDQRFKRGPSAYRRKTIQGSLSGKTFLIVTEGAKTEPNYLKHLRARLGLKTAEVVIVHPEGTDPITLVKKADELRIVRKKEAKKGFAIEYDEVWVVFDLERTHDERRKLATKAKQMKEGRGIHFAISDPCFEFWILLHYAYTTRSFDDCDSVIKFLKAHQPNYTKAHLPKELLDNLPNAVMHAERCRKHHEQGGGSGHPATQVDILVKHLNSATRAHLQYQLNASAPD